MFHHLLWVLLVGFNIKKTKKSKNNARKIWKTISLRYRHSTRRLKTLKTLTKGLQRVKKLR